MTSPRRALAALGAALLLVAHAAEAGRAEAAPPPWNLAGLYGVDAPHAWSNLVAAGAPGGRGVRVAVVDTGIASGEDLAGRLVDGWDFVGGDADPHDENGHGTFVASTIASETYAAQLMPVRVLDARGVGDMDTVARGVRFAVDHGAKVVNLSFTFGQGVGESQVAPLLEAIAYAAQRQVLVVGASGNAGAHSVDLPGRSPFVLSVGATTEFGCVAEYSNYGPELDVVAPGGGSDAAIDDRHCRAGRRGRAIERLGLAGSSVGTSMAVAHVSATAALVVASRIVGPDPHPARIVQRLRSTARDLGPPGFDERYGWGLVSAGAATAHTTRAVRTPFRYPRGSRAE